MDGTDQATGGEDAPALLTCREAAARLGVSRETINGWIRAGSLPVTRPDHDARSDLRRIRPADLAAAHHAAHAGGVVPRWRQDVGHAASRLRALRIQAGWSQRELAERAGIAHEVISRLERGQSAPQAKTVHTLARALDVPAEHFVAEEPVGEAMLTLAEVAAYLDVPVLRVWEWVRAGKLDGTQVASRWRVPASAVIDLERSGRLRGKSRRLDPRYRPDAGGHRGT